LENTQPDKKTEDLKSKSDALKQAEEQASFIPLAIRQCSEGVAVVDLDGNLKYLNEAFARMHGYSPPELIGKNISIFHTPDQMPSVEEANRQIKETGIFRGEIWHTRRDGSIFPGIMHNSLIRDDEGNPIYMLGLLRNITQRKQLEEALRKSEKQYRLLAENITDVILIIDVGRFTISYISPSAEKIFGYTPSAESVFGYTRKELANFNAFDFLTPQSVQKMKTVFNRELEKDKFGKAEAQMLELEVLRKTGSTIWIEVSARFLRDEAKQVKSILCVIRDISKRKKAEESLKKSELMLRRAKNKLEEKVRQRTAELQERNIALKVLLDQRDHENKKIEETILSNIHTLIEPNLNRLKNSRLSSKQTAAVRLLEFNLHQITSPFQNRQSIGRLKLSPMEIQVANFLKNGATTKEIAEALNLSRRTIDAHRYNIRKKIGIKGKGVSLKNYLNSL